MDNKWMILIVCEITAWMFTAIMAYSGYYFNITKEKKYRVLFVISLTIAVLTGWIPHIALSIVESIQEKRITPFLIFIIAIVVYGLTWGKKDIQKLNRWIERALEKRRE